MSGAKRRTAANISVLEALKLLDGQYCEVAQGIAKGKYALWLGSGISRDTVDDLRVIARRVLDYLSTEARKEEAVNGTYKRALNQALGHALTPIEKAEIDTTVEPAQWPNVNNIVERLVGRYSQLLDIRIEGRRSDHILWDVVDVRRTYASDDLNPDCEHKAVALLAIEGVFPKIASANWDGLVEKAVAMLTNGDPAILAVFVRADDMQGVSSRSAIHKFHGCAVRAKEDEGRYRDYIVGRQQQITDWPNDQKFALMKNQLDGISVTFRTLMVGLSAQDSNIQNIFSAGRAMLKRAWPSHPPAYVFAGDELGADQGTMLKSVYQDDYDAHQVAIEDSAKIPAYGKPLLSAIVLSVIGQKCAALIRLMEAPNLPDLERAKLISGALNARDDIASRAGPSNDDKRAFMDALIAGMSRSLAIFRGELTAISNGVYGGVSTATIVQLKNDPNLQVSAMPQLAAFCGLLGIGQVSDGWQISPSTDNAKEGSIQIITPASAAPRRVFIVSNSEILSRFVRDGVIDEEDNDTLVVVCSEPVLRRQTSPSSVYGRDDAPDGFGEFSFKDLVSEATSAAHLLARVKEEATL